MIQPAPVAAGEPLEAAAPAVLGFTGYQAPAEACTANSGGFGVLTSSKCIMVTLDCFGVDVDNVAELSGSAA